MIQALPRDPWGRDLRGRLHERTFESALLRGNPPGDPTSRPLWAYTPPGWPAGGPHPAIWCLQGFSGQVDMWRNRSAFQPTFIERLDVAIASGACPPVVAVFPDCWTSYGGSQFLDSPGTGCYQGYLCDELVPYVERELDTRPGPGGRGVLGKSSGGYGALVLAMLRPDVWGAAGAIAPDAGFEFCYLPDFPIAWKTLRAHGGSIDAFVEAVRTRSSIGGEELETLNLIGMAACYSARDDGEPELPWDAATGALRDEVWARWLAHDPVRMVPRHLDALRGLRALSIECGLRDEYRLYAGAQQLHAQLEGAGVPHRFELFDGGHGGLHERFPPLVAFLAHGLSSGREA